MNSRQLQYAVALSETKNFSQAAEKFNISQPAFSKQIIALENELGVKLFERGTTPISLTAAGSFFIEKTKSLLFEEEQLLKAMDDYKMGKRGTLVIGAPPFRSLYMIPQIIIETKKHFSDLEVVLVEKGISQLKKDLAEGMYDFAVMNLPVNEADFETIPLEKDTLVAAVPNTLLPLVKNISKSGIVKDLSCFRDVPFVTVGKGQEMRKLLENLSRVSGIKPDIYAEVTGVATAWEFVKMGCATTLLPRQFVDREARLYNVTLFEIEQTSYIRQPAIVTRRGQFVSEYARFAMKLMGK